MTPNVRGPEAKVSRVGPTLIAERQRLLAVAARVGDVVHGELHALVADAGAKVGVEHLREGVRVECRAGGVEVDEALLFFGVAFGHGERRVGSMGRLGLGGRMDGWGCKVGVL